MLRVAVALALLGQSPDTLTFSDSATASLIDRAVQRHGYQDGLVRDYSALIRTRIDAAFGRSRFARIRPLIAHETAARITWALPNDLKVAVIGEREASIFDEGEIEAAFDRPWFIPRGLGDSIRLVDDELPTTAALHPLAPGAARHYRYAIVDSVTLRIPGRTVKAVNVRVQPKTLGPSLIAGNLWLDEATAEVVRLMFVFVGKYLWEVPESDTPRDSVRARRDNDRANRIIDMEADLEYALYDARYWMPYRQLLQLNIEIPWFLNVAIPVRVITTFADYDVNTSAVPEFEVDPLDRGAGKGGRGPRRGRTQQRCRRDTEDCTSETGYFRVGESEGGGRWEVRYGPRDSLLDYEWPDPLNLALSKEEANRIKETIATLGQLEAQLPADWVGRTRHGAAFDSFSDLYRFNRVQGSSLGLGYQIRPGVAFTTLIATARYGFSDKRPTGSVAWRRDGPGGRLDVTAFRSVHEVEPWTGGLGFGNTMNGIFSAHDDADYYLALGGAVTFSSYGVGLLEDAQFTIAFERQRSMDAVATSGINDALGGNGALSLNPPVMDGDYLRAGISRTSRLGGATFRHGGESLLRLDEDGWAGRIWASLDLPFSTFRRTGRLTVRAGANLGDDMGQMLFRVGGPQTVRGHDYGTRRGGGFWSAQLDFALRRSAALTPVVFADVGNVFDVPDLGGVDGPLVGVGAGLSFLQGLIRLNVAQGVNPDKDLRFDLLFNAPR